MTKTKFSVGDRVRYSSTFCRTIGATTGFTPQARGVITSFSKTGELASITWDFVSPNGTRHGAANVFNLQKIR